MSSRFFANEPHQPRVRRAADATSIGIGLFFLIWTAATADSVASVESALVELAGSVPLWFEDMYRIAFFVGFLLIVALIATVVAQGSKRG